MAAGFAASVFGPSHHIQSAGAETGPGHAAAANAIVVMSELGIDIASHLTVSVSDVSLDTLDLAVVFRPSEAERLSFPASVRVEHLDIEDPYGRSVDVYRATARSIRRGVRQIYVDDAVHRLSATAGQAGSHVAGVFNRAAKELENELADFATRDLGISVHDKITLGQLVEKLKNAKLLDNPDVARLIAMVTEANDVWVRTKHRNEPTPSQLVAGLKAVGAAFRVLGQRTG